MITLSVTVTPPSGGTFAGVHLYFEGPDQSASPDYTVGSSAIGGTASITGPWFPVDVGVQKYVAGQPMTVTFPAPPSIDPTVDTPCRLYAAPYSAAVDNPLVRAGLPGATPSQTFTLVSLDSGTPNAGTNVTGLIGGSGAVIGITGSALSPVNVTGKLETPVLVTLTDTPANTPGWVARLVLVVGNLDPTAAANQQVVADSITQSGPVYAPSGDGISVPHSFALDTPTALTAATVYLQAGLVDSSGNLQWNNIVVGITPAWPFTYGSTTGTTDASSVMAATIAATMAVVNGLFGVAALGITNPFLGSAAVATINVQALAITNPLLASLAVQAANMAANSVTAGNSAIAAAAVGTAAIQNAAITNALIANLAVSGAQIQNATITSTQIANATIANANLGSAIVAQANIANLAVGTAQIQSLAVTGAKIANATITAANIANATITSAQISSLDVTLLNAGTISVAVSLTAPTLTITSGSVTINLDGTNFLKLHNSGSGATVQVTGDNITVSNSGVGRTVTITPAQYSISDTSSNAGYLISTALQFSTSGGSILQVVGPRQTGPGAPSFTTVSDVQTWCNNLYNALRASGGHGLIN